MKTPEQNRKAVAAYYAAHREEMRQKAREKYKVRRVKYLAELDQRIQTNYKSEIELAGKQNWPVLISTESKYRKCPRCGLYYDQMRQVFIDGLGVRQLVATCLACDEIIKHVEPYYSV